MFHYSDIVRPPTGFSEGHQSRLGKPVDDWSKEDVILWLESIKLGKYSDHFLGKFPLHLEEAVRGFHISLIVCAVLSN